MPWARLDDRYDDVRKIKRALRTDPAAIALHVMAITYCNRHNTDGEIEADRVEEWIALMPYRAVTKRKLLDALFDLRLFERQDEETFRVHDYLDWNRSSAERAALAEQGRRGGLARAQANAKPSPDGGSGPGLANAKPSPSEGSSTPRHATPRHERTSLSDADRADTKADPVVVDLSERLAARVRANDPKANPDPRSVRWLTDMRLLLQDRGGDAAEVERIIDWCQADSFWRCNVLSPAKLRKQFTQLVLKARPGATVTPLRPSAGDLIRKLNESEASA